MSNPAEVEEWRKALDSSIECFDIVLKDDVEAAAVFELYLAMDVAASCLVKICSIKIDEDDPPTLSEVIGLLSQRIENIGDQHQLIAAIEALEEFCGQITYEEGFVSDYGISPDEVNEIGKATKQIIEGLRTIGAKASCSSKTNELDDTSIS